MKYLSWVPRFSRYFYMHEKSICYYCGSMQNTVFGLATNKLRQYGVFKIFSLGPKCFPSIREEKWFLTSEGIISPLWLMESTVLTLISGHLIGWKAVLTSEKTFSPNQKLAFGLFSCAKQSWFDFCLLVMHQEIKPRLHLGCIKMARN